MSQQGNTSAVVVAGTVVVGEAAAGIAAAVEPAAVAESVDLLGRADSEKYLMQLVD